jgi:hypothetical protein
MILKCQQPDPNPRPPRFRLPPGATDTHIHIFGPNKTYPLVAGRRFTPPDASVESYLHLHRTLGLSRAVLVQPSSYGIDNRRQLDAAREMDIPTRVVVVVPPAMTDRELDDLYRAGARAVRFIPTQPGCLPLAQLERYAERLAALGWHIQLMLAPTHLVELAPRLEKLRCDFAGPSFRRAIMPRSSRRPIRRSSRWPTRWSRHGRTGCCGAPIGRTRILPGRCRTQPSFSICSLIGCRTMKFAGAF